MATFATHDELAALLGATFTAEQQTAADVVLELATDAILAAVDKDTTWADALTDVPSALKVLCLSIARRVTANPTGARSQSEQLGAYQHSESFADQAAGGLELSTSERLSARRAVYGSNTASVRVGALIDDHVVHSHFVTTSLDETEDCS